ncbi:MAG: transcription initiation factor IIB [Candidatus Aenigmatarchaeota archaeon]|nr:MAG: transcription initiation factor IIB [Candidatus Aenigmarchaeota archaeon]
MLQEDLEERCPECGSRQLIEDKNSGEKVCTSCGRVISRIIDEGPERRIFDWEEVREKMRVGPPETVRLHDKGLGSVIGAEDRDSKMNLLDSEKKYEIFRLRKWQKRIRMMDPKDRSLSSGLRLISTICNTLSFHNGQKIPSQVENTACTIYRKALERKLIKGKTISGVATASVYYAVRKHGLPVRLREVAESAGISQRDVGKIYRYLVKRLGDYVEPPSISTCLNKLCSYFRIYGDAERVAHETCRIAREKCMAGGKDPYGIAAASAYISLVLYNQKKTQKEIARVAGTTDATLRNRYKELKKGLLFILKI